jgi:hypothetical protein
LHFCWFRQYIHTNQFFCMESNSSFWSQFDAFNLVSSILFHFILSYLNWIEFIVIFVETNIWIYKAINLKSIFVIDHWPLIIIDHHWSSLSIDCWSNENSKRTWMNQWINESMNQWINEWIWRQSGWRWAWVSKTQNSRPNHLIFQILLLWYLPD